MSLDIWLSRTVVVKATGEEREEVVWERNITHNLGKMAKALGCYEAVWRPEEIGITTAEQVIPCLEKAVNELEMNPENYRKYEPANGWGQLSDLNDFLTSYLLACREYPYATIDVSR